MICSPHSPYHHLIMQKEFKRNNLIKYTYYKKIFFRGTLGKKNVIINYLYTVYPIFKTLKICINN